ncbi:MAG: transcriptional repressor [Clostridia bacterium]|nr:transcriptional repressor [Clostridia bacterium]
MTRQRAVILEVLRSDMCHHTAEEIFELAKAKLPTISRATVYNNLKALESERLIRRITAEGTKDRYDNAFVPHGHLFCTMCSEVTDFQIPNFKEKLEGIAGDAIDSYELKVRYVCPRCKKAAAGE